MESKKSKLLEEFTICVTGLSPAERKFAQNVAVELKGTYQETISSSCRFLIATKVGSKKYQEAVSFSIPIVNYSFLLECFEQKSVVDYRPFILGCFVGLSISITGFYEDISKKQELIKSIEENGGFYSGNLEYGKTTHLIVAEDNYEGEKHKAAKEWNLQIVSPQWVDVCVDIGAWVNETDYRPTPKQQLLQQKKTQQQQQQKKNKNEEKVNLMSDLNIAQTEEVQKEIEEEKSFWLECKLARKGKTCLRNQLLFIECREDLERWKILHNIANFCGAMVAWEYSTFVTHTIVVKDMKTSSQDMDAILREYKSKNPNCKFVLPNFLIECAQNNEMADEKEFQYKGKKQEPLKNLLVCVSNYFNSERLEVERLCNELGGTFTDRLTRSVNILICKGDKSEKYIKALEWSIKIHDLEWLRKKYVR